MLLKYVIFSVKVLLTLDATNDISLMRDSLFVRPMVDKRSVQETCLKTVIIYKMLFDGMEIKTHFHFKFC